MAFEVMPPHLANPRDARGISAVDIQLDDVAKRGTRRAQHRTQIPKDLVRLFPNVSLADDLALLVLGHLARDEHHVAHAPRVGVPSCWMNTRDVNLLRACH